MALWRGVFQGFKSRTTAVHPERWFSVVKVQTTTAPKITRIDIFQFDVHMPPGGFTCGNETAEKLVTTIVRVKTNLGVDGWGECCPFASLYSPAYSEGTRTGVQKIAPALIGKNPTYLQEINHVMDSTLSGHPFDKYAFDVACWDILGKMANLPLCTLFGGRFGESVPSYRSISQSVSTTEAQERIRQFEAEGYSVFQLKVGGDADKDIEKIQQVASVLSKSSEFIVDGNRGYNTISALKLIEGIRHIRPPIIIEQLCDTYEENLFIRQRYPFAMTLDESADSLQAIMRISHDKAADIIKIKTSRFGGLTGALQARNLCSSLGIPVAIEDVGSWSLNCSALMHLAHSTIPKFRRSFFDMISDQVSTETILAPNTPKSKNGRISAPNGPGLGVEPSLDMLGEPLAVIE